MVLEIISDQKKKVPVTSLICAALHQANTQDVSTLSYAVPQSLHEDDLKISHI